MNEEEVETMKGAIRKLAGLGDIDNVWHRIEKIEPPETRSKVKENILFIVDYICK